MPVPTETKEEIELSYEQQQVLDLVKQRRNVFFTGSAGTGKSMLLKRIIKYLRDIHGDRDRYAVTASTGIAGVNVGGSTLYSWAGIGLAKEPAEELVGKIWGISKRQRKKEAERKMKETEQRRLKGLPPLREDDERKPHGLAERWQIVDTLIVDEISMIDGKLFDKTGICSTPVARQLSTVRRNPGDAFFFPPVPTNMF
ncbi:hypothetical protein EW026_g1183 [Hermanssonia centrifuga]|uniref:ATP-dependent DNA helicase n=1 Tax=Hermanssonia centrifuga TaxID=98765 RepID=A0A4V3XBC2_9APHY|nr:hypothetical protein EW026_g1183 [Hermanssonia centrifuga]